MKTAHSASMLILMSCLSGCAGTGASSREPDIPAGENVAHTLLGRYQGILKHVEGYSKTEGEACQVSIRRIDMYGSAYEFEIDDDIRIVFEERYINREMRTDGRAKPRENEEHALRQVKLYSAGDPRRSSDTVLMQLGDDGSLAFMKMQTSYKHYKRILACGELVQKDSKAATP